MTSHEIRSRFLKFFEARNHRVVQSSSLVPANDPTLLFSNAGMNQFKDVFLGRERRDYVRACSSQKCVRAGGKHNDLEQVGRTTRHHTFFEMLGNFSFGDYFKKDAIPWAWELITKEFAIPSEKLYVTVFREDDEAEGIWAQDVGVPRDRIFRLDEHDNFWQMGDTGPCGPCSEIHYDLGPAASAEGHTDCKFPCECGRYVELWNLVFMQFNRDEQGLMTTLPKPSIDTGAGLERLASVLQGKLSNFETDLFHPLIEEAAALASVEYGANHDADVSLRIIADHARASTFLISDGVLPSNEGRGYVLRKIMRRAIDNGRLLGIEGSVLGRVATRVVDMMAGPYPELAEARHHILRVIAAEESKYASLIEPAIERLQKYREALKAAITSDHVSHSLARILERFTSELPPGEVRVQVTRAFKDVLQAKTRWGEEIQEQARGKRTETRGPIAILEPLKVELARLVQEVKDASEAERDEVLRKIPQLWKQFGDDYEALAPPVNGAVLFFAYDTLGLRPDFVLDLARTRGWPIVPEAESQFQELMQEQRERARASWKGAEKKIALPVYSKLAEDGKTEFDGYTQTTSANCRIMALIQKGEPLSEVQPGSEVEIVLDHTPFYAEAGGQVGDTGHFLAPATDHEVAHVLTTYYPVSGLIVHKAVAREGLRMGDVVTAIVDTERRDATRRNHTATHLLHAALRKTLGTHVKQAGSLVAPDRLRFDFTHYTGLGEQDVLDIEDLVNEHILKNEEVSTAVMDLDTAVNTGAMALFGEKYADQVRVLTIDDFSKELCGGTHVRRTGDIGLFKVISEGSVAAGTRRIEALTGTGVLELIRRYQGELEDVREAIRPGLGMAGVARRLLGGPSPADEVRTLVEQSKKLRKELEAQQMKRAASAAGDLVQQAREIKGVRVVAARVEVTDRSAMRQMVDDLRAKLQSGVIVLGSVAEGRVSLIAAVTKDLTAKLDAGRIVKQAAAYVEGSGGGRKDLAEAGGKNPAKLDESLQAVPGIIEQML